MIFLFLLLVVRGCALARRTTSAQRVALFVDGAEEHVPLASPALAAAAQSGRLQPKLRFARHVLGRAEPWKLLTECPRLVSAPLTALLAPRHAYLQLCGARCGAELSVDELELLCSLSDADFVELCCSLGGAASLNDYDELRLAFRRGPREAARQNHASYLACFLKHGWVAESDRDRRGASTLHWAAGHGGLEACAMLLQVLDVDDVDTDRSTPLHWAAVGVDGNAFGVGAKIETMLLLLSRGADPNARTKDGNTVAHWASWSGGLDSLELLLANGASLDAVNENGCHSAHWAAAGGDTRVLEYLLAHDQDLTLPNKAGHTPLQHAVAHGRLETAEWFIRKDIVDTEAVEYASRIAKLDGSRGELAMALQAPFVVPNL